MRRYGWLRQLPDFRDFKYKVPFHILKALPPSVDLRPLCPPVYDQGSLGSCTANAIGSADQFCQMKQQGHDVFIPSRLFIYWNERDMEGTVNQDSGAYIRDGMKVVAQQGVCPEAMWPYEVARFREKPSNGCYTEAAEHQTISYNAVTQTLDELRGCLADGFPFVFGFSVYEGFESTEVAKTGIMPMPGQNESLLGGHAVKAVGYDDAKRWFIVKNSWGTGWGDGGYFYMPYDFIVNPNMASDFWTIRLVEDEDANNPHPTPEPPKPEPKWDCDWSLALPVVKAFVDGAVSEADAVRARGNANVPITPQANQMVEAGLRGVQQYLNRVLTVRNRRK